MPSPENTAVMTSDIAPTATGTAMPAAMAPSGPRERMVSLDALRGVAVLGILLINVVSMGLPFAALDDPTIAGNRSPVDFWCWAVATVLAEGKMRAIFSMLFGAGVVLAVHRAETRGAHVAAADVHLRRHLWLVLFGAVHSYLLLWPGDVLFTYGVAGLPLLAFRRLRPRTLIVVGVLILALQTPRIVLENKDLAQASAGLREIARLTTASGTLTPDERRSADRWKETLSREKPTPQMLKETIDARRRGYLSNLAAAAAASLYIESVYLYTVGLWDAVAVMFIGMALLKLGVLSGDRSFRFYGVLAVAGYAIGIPVAVGVVADWTRHDFDAGMRWTSLDHITRVPIALAHVAMVIMVVKARGTRRVTAPLAAVGRMALTNYILQTVICVTIFSGVGFGWFGQLARHQLYYIVAGIWVFQVASSALWLRRYRFGPMEWLWRSLTYQRRETFRAQNEGSEPANTSRGLQ